MLGRSMDCPFLSVTDIHIYISINLYINITASTAISISEPISVSVSTYIYLYRCESVSLPIVKGPIKFYLLECHFPILFGTSDAL